MTRKLAMSTSASMLSQTEIVQIVIISTNLEFPSGQKHSIENSTASNVPLFQAWFSHDILTYFPLTFYIPYIMFICPLLTS